MKATIKTIKNAQNPHKFNRAEINYSIAGEKKTIKLIHNMGAEIGAAFNSWVYRTKEHTAEALIKYIESKYLGFILMTEAQYIDSIIEKKADQ